jgi:ferredoxin
MFACVATASLVACGGSGSPGTTTTPPPAISVTLTGAPTSLLINATAALTATVANDSANAGVKWSVTCGSSGACGAFTNPTATTATYTAPAAVPTGNTVTVTATSLTDSTKSASATITIKAISVTLSGAPALLTTNATAALTATVTNDSANAGVTWSVTCGSSGSCGAFANATATTATYTAPAAVPTGNTVTVTATSVTDTTASASATITIEVISVSLSGAPASLATTAAATLTATVTNDSANAGVAWSVTCGTTGACGVFTNTTTTSATYTAPATPPSGNTVTVTATSVTDTTKSASATITIVPVLAVTLGPAPTSLQISTGAAFTAFVTNDSANAGVTWTATCGSANCGSFSAAKSLAGIATDFTAPSAVPTGATITVTVTSVTDTTKSATTQITITAANTVLANGTYVFSLAGTNASGPYYVAGAFTVNGTSITGGEQDYIDLGTIAADKIDSDSNAISTTANGDLQITLTACNGANCSGTDTNVGVNGVETLDAALFSTTRARIVEFDSSATSSGRLDPQPSPAAPSAGYSFFASGLDAHAIPLAIGGVLNINGPGTISGAGSVFDMNDSVFEGAIVLQNQSFAASTVSAPDSFGRIVFSLVPSAASGVPTFNLVGYIVDSTHIRLIETSDLLNATLSGIALGQGANTGTFTSAGGNSYVAALNGFNGTGAFQAAGLLVAGSNNSLGGLINFNDLTGTWTEAPLAISSGNNFPANSNGRVMLNGVAGGLSTPFSLVLYLTSTGPGSEATMISVDSNDVLAGLAWQQTGLGSFTDSSFFGTYALDATGAAGPLTSISELDAVGPTTADGAGTVTGSVNLNWILGSNPNSTFPDSPVSATFTSNSNGVFTGNITGLDVTNCPIYSASGSGCSADAFVYYVIDATKVVAIETDQNQLTLGLFTLEQ